MLEDAEDTTTSEEAMEHPGRIFVMRNLKRMLGFAINCLRGVGQVFFMNNPLSGLVVLIGLLVQSPRVATYGKSQVCDSVTACSKVCPEQLAIVCQR